MKICFTAAAITVVAPVITPFVWSAAPEGLGTAVAAQEPETGPERFGYLDVFGLEVAADPRISPDGSRVVYVRSGFDIMTDGTRTALWVVKADGSEHRALTDGTERVGSPRWAPDGNRLLYRSSREGSTQLFLRWMDAGQVAELTNLTESPGNLAWSPDGEWIAMTMLVPETGPPIPAPVGLPAKPDGATWKPPPLVIDRMRYRSDGVGYRPRGNTHVFVMPAEGGTPRQVTTGPYDHSGPLSWTPDSRAIVFSANRGDPDYEVRNSEIFRVEVGNGEITQITERFGPDLGPAVSPGGGRIAYTGYDDRYQGYQVRDLYVMDADGGRPRNLTADLDRDVNNVTWGAEDEIYFQYDDEGTTKIARISLDGRLEDVATDVGGVSLGRPYASGSFTLADGGTVAFTVNSPSRPADVAVATPGGAVTQVTALNEDLLAHRALASVEELWWESSHDGRPVHGWLAKPPGFDPERRYPLLLEIHGGPFSNYGPRFAPEIQLYAAADYLVLYTNPRGSTSYGGEFGNLIHHAYPGDDYYDLMSGIDAVVEQGIVDEGNLMVTGGSGGGVLSAWLVGRTDRFRAAVVQKPVIDWISFSLTSDGYPSYYQYWFPAPVWEEGMLEHYWERSPLSLVGNVTTPTMLITGEEDLRTPMGETEQYYQALQIRGVPTQMVRIQGAFHGMASSSPSNLINKVAYVLEWLERHRSRRSVSE